MGQIKIEGAPEHVSWSSLNGYWGCPQRWYLERVVKVDQRPGFASMGGRAVHRGSEDVDYAILTSGFDSITDDDT